MYSRYKLNKQDDDIQPWDIPFPIWNQSVVPCLVLTVASWPKYGFLRRQVRWSGIPSLSEFSTVCCDPHSQRLLHSQWNRCFSRIPLLFLWSNERKWKCYSRSSVRFFVAPWTKEPGGLQFMEFSRQEYWSMLPFPSLGDLPNPGIETRSPTFQTNSLPFELPGMLAIWSLVPLPFLNSACTFGNSQFMYCWSLAWKILSITLLVCEMSTTVQWIEHFLVLFFFGIWMKTGFFQFCGHCWAFCLLAYWVQHSSRIIFRMWNSSAGIISSPPAPE